MEKLKILLVLQTPWGTSLGVSKVHYDLKAEYEKLGHQVDYLDWNKLYPKGQSSYNKITGSLYSVKILDYLKKYARKYNVIDANYNCIPYPKTAYHFNGVVLYRSHGLQPLYRQVEQSAAYKKMEDITTPPHLSLKTRIGNLSRFLQKSEGDYELFSSANYADVVHVLNKAEYDYFLEYGIAAEKLLLVPNAIPDEQIRSFKQDSAVKKKAELSFVGSWTLRKGIKDFNAILEEVQKSLLLDQVSILGGGYGSNPKLLIDAKYHGILAIKPHFSQNELPNLLKTSKVGIFPSYVEGFGLAILEQLARGVPVVAYNTPGPADILGPLDKTLLVKPGDTKAFSKKVVELLSLSEENYNILSAKCIKRTEAYKMSTIAQKFISIYEATLIKVNQEA